MIYTLKNFKNNFCITAYDAEDDGLIQFKEKYGTPMRVDYAHLMELAQKTLPQGLYDTYSGRDEFKINWTSKTDNGTSGTMEFFHIKDVLGDWSDSYLYSEENLAENELLGHYRPFERHFEYLTCGIITLPSFEDSIYCHLQPESDTMPLDLNFSGYLRMAAEARIFQYWPLALVEIHTEKLGPYSKAMQEKLPDIFPDFSWDVFVELYESLRLSRE